MPGGDGTGPVGMGPMTGRAAGYCAGYPVPGYMNGLPGRGFRGWGGRGGRGRRNWFYATGLTGWQRAAAGWPVLGAAPPVGPSAAPLTEPQQAEMLKAQVQQYEDMLADLRRRIADLEAKAQK